MYRGAVTRGVPTQGEDLPEEDPEGPHVAQRGIEAVEDALWGHPLQRQEGLWAGGDGLSARRVQCIGQKQEAWGSGAPNACTHHKTLGGPESWLLAHWVEPSFRVLNSSQNMTASPHHSLPQPSGAAWRDR